MTNRDPRLDAKTAFYTWHHDHGSQAHADMTRDLENAADSPYQNDSTEYWLVALGSAHQAFADFANGDS